MKINPDYVICIYFGLMLLVFGVYRLGFNAGKRWMTYFPPDNGYVPKDLLRSRPPQGGSGVPYLYPETPVDKPQIRI